MKMYFYKNVPLRRYFFALSFLCVQVQCITEFFISLFLLLLSEMARGSMSGGRERIMTNSVGSLSHLPPTSMQEDLNNELNAVRAFS